MIKLLAFFAFLACSINTYGTAFAPNTVLTAAALNAAFSDAATSASNPVSLNGIPTNSTTNSVVTASRLTSGLLPGSFTTLSASGAITGYGGASIVGTIVGTTFSGSGSGLTGTASSLTAGNVTTNANLTGQITSVGNAAVLGSFTLAQLNAAVSDANIARTDAANSLTGSQTITTSGSTGTAVLIDTGANGVNIAMTGDGATTPKKYIKVSAGQLDIVNDAYTSNLLSLTDGGALSTAGSIRVDGNSGVTDATINSAASVGLYLRSKTGSVFDFAIQNPGGGAYIAQVPTGTLDITFGGAVTATGGTLTNTTFVNPALGTIASGIATNLTGTAAGLSIGGNAATAGAASTATSLAGGAGGTIPYQSTAGTTAMLANGTAGQVLQSNGTTLAPSWATVAAVFGYQAAGALTGALDGINQSYTLPQTPAGTPLLLINGVGAILAVDYTIVGTAVTHLGTALSATDSFTFAEYRY